MEAPEQEESSVNLVFKKRSKPFIGAVRESRMDNSPYHPMFVSDRFEIGEEDLKALGLKNPGIQDLSVVSYRLKRESHKRKKHSARLKMRQKKMNSKNDDQ